jgi:hypothetical protein
MIRAMNTIKGTHIDYPKKRGIRVAADLAMLTICLFACVCTPLQIFAQEGDTKPTIHIAQANMMYPENGFLWHSSGRNWIMSGIQRSFGLRELDQPWLHLGAKRSQYSIALGSSTLGWDSMREWAISSSANFTSDGIHVAIGAQYSMLRLRQPYRNDRAVTFGAGINKKVHNTIDVTVSIQNLLDSEWLIGGDPIERKLQVDVSSSVFANVLIRGGLGVSDQFPADYRTHILWKFNDALIFNLGVGSVPSRIDMGVRIDSHRWVAGSSFSKLTNASIGWRQNHWLGRVSE